MCGLSKFRYSVSCAWSLLTWMLNAGRFVSFGVRFGNDSVFVFDPLIAFVKRAVQMDLISVCVSQLTWFRCGVRNYLIST